MGTKPREMSGKVFKTDPDREFGRESRSLKACYELFEVKAKLVLSLFSLPSVCDVLLSTAIAGTFASLLC